MRSMATAMDRAMLPEAVNKEIRIEKLKMPVAKRAFSFKRPDSSNGPMTMRTR